MANLWQNLKITINMVCEKFVTNLATNTFRGNFVKRFVAKLLQNILHHTFLPQTHFCGRFVARWLLPQFCHKYVCGKKYFFLVVIEVNSQPQPNL